LENPNGTDRPNNLENPRAELTPQQEAAPRGWLVRNGIYLVLVAAIFLSLKYFAGADYDDFRAGIVAALGLGLVIFIHELGHFAVAKWCDVHVEAFSIGFGPPLPGCCFKWGETTYMIALFPIGGYVKMVGEGAENDESDTDPRSFKNKPVWQRMAIISAGVTMNVILAFICSVYVFMTRGDERQPGVVGKIDTGGPAFVQGVREGDEIYQIGSKGPNPAFEVLKKVVTNSKKGEALDFVFGPPGASEAARTRTQIIPRKESSDLTPMIGLAPPNQLRLLSNRYRKTHSLPLIFSSAASRADPPFQFDDVILATTDPDHTGQILDIPPDPRNPENRDYFEFVKRMRRLAGKEVTIRVQRQQTGKVENIRVPPEFNYSIGAKMRMGKIAAIRERSPAASAGVQPSDIIEQVEVGAGQDKRVLQKILDPERLPFDLEQWAEKEKGPKQVTLKLLRKNSQGEHSERRQEEVVLAWDDSWKDYREVPFDWSSPLSVPALGLAYYIETTIVEVEKGSPAEKAGLKKDDVIKEIQFYSGGKTPAEEAKPNKWKSLGSQQWAFVSVGIQGGDIQHRWRESKKIGLKVDRDQKEITVVAEEDKNWPSDDRGLLLLPDERLFIAESLVEALGMGVEKTTFYIDMIFGNLRGIFTGRNSVENFGGPITIARIAFYIASDDIYNFLIFLGVIGVNLAVINFLPIPVLDGGHMVFLIYERLRGKPAPERVRLAATFVGVAFVVCLMLFTIYLDVSRLF